MNQKRPIGVLVVLLLLFSSLALASDSFIPCTNAAECQSIFGQMATCSPSTINPSINTCFDSLAVPGSNASLTTPLITENYSLEQTALAPLPSSSLTTPIQNFEQLQQRLEQMELNYQQLLPQVQDLSNQLFSINANLQTLNANVQTLSSQQNNLQSVEEKITSVSTGLAVMQEDLDTTKENVDAIKADVTAKEAFNKLILFIILIIISIVIASAIIYFLLRHHHHHGSPQEIVRYITQHLQKGLKFSQIKSSLVQSGWSEEQISRAYQETLRRTATSTISKSSPAKTASYDRNKIITITIVSILLLGGVLLILRGISTGQAIHFQEEAQLDTAAKMVLERSLSQSSLYPLVDFANICVEIHDQEKSASYQIVKTPLSHSVKKVTTACSSDDSYDLAIQFNSWESFSSVSRNMECNNLQLEHLHKGVYVLPSQYILPGFRLNPDKDPVKFCKVLSSCLTAEQLNEVGVSC